MSIPDLLTGQTGDIMGEIPGIFSAFNPDRKGGVIPGDQYRDVARRVRERVDSSFMLELYACHTTDRGRPGLYLFPSATGSGKTYQACELMAMWIVAFDMGEPQRPVYFMTPLKKNLPDRKELVDHLAGFLSDNAVRAKGDSDPVKKLAGALYDRYVARLDNKVDSVVAALCGSGGYLDDRIRTMNDHIRQIRNTAPRVWNETGPEGAWPLLDRLASAIRAYETAGGHYQDPDRASGANKGRFTRANPQDREEARKRLDPLVRDFLNIVHGRVSAAIKAWWDGKSKEEKAGRVLDDAARIEFVTHSPVWNWIPELMPDALYAQRPVKLMSAKKFLYGTTPIVTPRIDFLHPKNLKHAIVLMDEFDAIKNDMTDYLIDQATANTVDVIQTMSEIRSLKDSRCMPADVTALIEGEEADGETRQSLAEQFQRVREAMDQVWNDYHLEYAYQLCKDLRREDDSSYLLRSRVFDSVFTGSRRMPRCRADEDDRKVWLEIPPDQKDKRYFSIAQVLGQCQGAITMFAQFIARLAYKRLGGTVIYEDALVRRQCVYTLLNDYMIRNEATQKIILDIVESTLLSYTRNHEAHASGGDGFTLYRYPIDIYQVIDTPYCADYSEFRRYELSVMPEHLLLRMAKNANVLAMSATCTVPTPFRNFDLDYLKERLGDRYGMPDPLQVMTLEDEYHQRRVTPQVQVDMIGSHDSHELFGFEQFAPDTRVLFDGKLADLCMDLHDSCMKPKTDKPTDYYVDVCHKLLDACIRMLRDDDTRSMICFLNGYPTDTGAPLNKTLLKKAVELARLMHLVETRKATPDTTYEQLDQHNKVHFQVMTTTNQAAVSRDWKEPLKTGRKTIIVTTYSGFATGQNLQHEYTPEGYPGGDPAKNHKRKTRGRVKREKDFDAAFLLSPTHIVVNRADGNSGNTPLITNIMKRCLQISYLAATGEILNRDANTYIADALNNQPADSMLYKTNATYLAADTIIIQAIGRLCRTNVKAKRVHLYLDDQLIEKTAPLDTTAMMMNDETRTVFDELNKRRTTKPHQNAADRQRFNKTYTSAREISAMCDTVLGHTNHNTTDRQREQNMWTAYRETIARHPYLANRTDLEHLKTTTANLVEEGARRRRLCDLIESSYITFDRPVREYWAHQDDRRGDARFPVYDRFSDKPKSGAGWVQVGAQSMRFTRLHEIEGLESLFAETDDPIKCPFPDSMFMVNPVVARNVCQGAIGELAGAMLFELAGAGRCVPIRNSDHMELADGQLEDYEDAFVDFKNWSTDHPDNNQRRKDAGKALRLGARVLFIANIVGEFGPRYESYYWQAWRRGPDGEPQPADWKDADTRVVYLSTLVSLQNGRWRLDPGIVDAIRQHLERIK